MIVLLVTLGVHLAATGASPITFHIGYSQATFVADKSPRLDNFEQFRSGHIVGMSNVFPRRYADVRLGIAIADRGTWKVHLNAVEMSALVELDLPLSYIVLAGPYADLQLSCCGPCPDRKINGGIKYGIGIRTTYRKTKIPLSLDVIREEGLRRAYSPRPHGKDSYKYHKGFLIQAGIRLLY